MQRAHTVLLAAITALIVQLTPLVAAHAADAWPTRPVHFIIPFGAGSGVDITARLLGDKLSAKWGQPVVVENRPGGDAFIAITSVLNANDDHVLLFAPASGFTAHPYLHDKLPYKASDLIPIARVTNTLIGIGVPATLGVSTLKEFIAKLRAEPGKLNYASVTGANDLLFAAFLKTENLTMAKVPYKDPVQAINDLAEGRIQTFVSAYAILRPRVQSGKVKVLALTNLKRAPALPDLPTAQEEGFKSLNFEGLTGLLGPRSVPVEVRKRIAADIADVLKDQAVAARLETTGQVVNPGGPEEFAADIAAQRAAVVQIGKTLGLKPAAE